jgi:hypothetical protein
MRAFKRVLKRTSLVLRRGYIGVADLAGANHHHPDEERVGAVRCLKSLSLQEWREALRV